MPNDWMKGGLRYKRLKRAVPEYLAPETVRAFFIAVAAERQPLHTMTKTEGAVRALETREFVVALTDEKLYLLRMGGLGVFSARLEGTEREFAAAEAPVEWKAGKFVLAGEVFQPFHYHDEDAEHLVRLLRS
jgi:hypothetical protein